MPVSKPVPGTIPEHWCWSVHTVALSEHALGWFWHQPICCPQTDPGHGLGVNVCQEQFPQDSLDVATPFWRVRVFSSMNMGHSCAICSLCQQMVPGTCNFLEQTLPVAFISVP